MYKDVYISSNYLYIYKHLFHFFEQKNNKTKNQKMNNSWSIIILLILSKMKMHLNGGGK